ncbi:MAG: TrkA family potassium uptake protein [Clostridiales bacterium]|nr:TrkA family potassium uptake protein [Clostridiales bacterium]
MSLKKTYAVLGLGRYGRAVATELVRSGADVLAVDIDEDIVNELANEIPVIKCADVTDAEVIRRLEIGSIDVVIIAMASNLEANVMAIMLCKEAGTKTIIVKCANETQERIFTRVGADRVVFPESESGTRMAKNLLSSGFVDIIDLSKDISMVELDVRPEWAGKSIRELELRRRHSINIVAICRGDRVSSYIEPDLVLESDMRLIVIANIEKLKRLR